MTEAIRPSVTQTMFDYAVAASKRSTCPARQIGAAIADGDELVATGYNGSPRGMGHCSDVGCVVIPAKGIRDSTRASDHREYSTHVHAELNAILSCARRGQSTKGCTVYVTAIPCLDCLKAIKQSGIVAVYWGCWRGHHIPHREQIEAYAADGDYPVEMIAVEMVGMRGVA